MTDKQRTDTMPAFLQLRQDIRSSLRQNNGQAYYLIEDPASGAFFRLGLREWALATRLNGQTSLADIAKSLTSGGEPDSSKEVEATARLLVSTGLVVPIDRNGRVCTNQVRAAPKAEPNPFFIRIPLCHPDRLLELCFPWTKWLFSWPFFLLWLGIVACGVYSVCNQWHRFTEATLVYLSPYSWFSLWILWWLLKAIHECGHGLICKKYGGHIGSAGIALILFSPVAFMDVTSAWRFRSTRQRIYTSAGGMYLELLVAGIAAIVWSQVSDGVTSQMCHGAIVMAGVTTILFNGNPLMRFDGYYIVSDLLGIQNLYVAGQQFVRNVFRRVFLGMPAQTTIVHQPFRRWIVNTYGIAATLWRILVCVSLILLASTMFYGADLVIALFGVAVWGALPLCRFVNYLVRGQDGKLPNRRRFLAAATTTCGLSCAIWWMPWPGGICVPAVVTYAPESVVRNLAAGFVEEVHVASGQRVSKGQLLVTLGSLELVSELEDAKLAFEQSHIRCRQLNSQGEIAAYQAEHERLTALETRLVHLRTQVAELEVRAPTEGFVVGRRLRDLVGQYIVVGTPLLEVVDESHKEIQLSVPEVHVHALQQKVGQVPSVRVLGANEESIGHLAIIDPRATVALTQPALGGHFGGPLAVKESTSDETEGNAPQTEYELVAPRVNGTVALSPVQSKRMTAGRLAKVRIDDSQETLGRRVHRGITSWVRQKLNQRALVDS